MSTMKESKKDFLWQILFLIIFMNGFEAGGYQASLWHIGKEFDLSATSMGLYAAMELFATMLAPILLGRWADSVKKEHSICLLLGLQIATSVTVLAAASDALFLVSIFFLGLTTSALQFISIAALADAYPVTSGKKIAWITSMYAAGAFLSPLAVDRYLRSGLSWRTLFCFLALGSVFALAGILYSGCSPREVRPCPAEEGSREGKLVLGAVLLLGVIMCIYVGFENGFTFFVDTLFTDVLNSSSGKFALSLFWAVMIPSRILVGHFSRHTNKILIGALLLIPAAMLVLQGCSSPAAAMLLCIPLGCASGAIYPCVLTIMLPFAGKSTATATGIITSATGIGGVVFTAATGFLADRFGLRAAMLILVSFFAISLVSAILVTGGRQKPSVRNPRT